jgi:hypothetical protein
MAPAPAGAGGSGSLQPSRARGAATSQKGLAINDPSQQPHLRHAPGRRTVSALQVACSPDLGVQLLLPGQQAIPTSRSSKPRLRKLDY